MDQQELYDAATYSRVSPGGDELLRRLLGAAREQALGLACNTAHKPQERRQHDAD